MTLLGLLFLAVAFVALIRGQAWWAGRWVRRLREPQRYWTSIGGCVLIALLLVVIGPLR